MTTPYPNLKHAAEALEIAGRATPGPWQANSGYGNNAAIIEGISNQVKVDVIVDDGTYDERFTGVIKAADGKHIAHFNPAFTSNLIRAYIEAVETLEHVDEFCCCERFKTKGFDYGEEHKRAGKPKPGSRWLTPLDVVREFLAKIGEAK